jgi:serine/threonine-protein kinase
LTTALGPYDLGRELGRGAMGIVHEAVHRELGRRVAVKLLPRVALDDGERIAAFQREARAAAQVRHPGVVAVHDAGVVDGQPFLAMELIGGPSLEDRLRDGPLPPREAAKLVAAVAHAVHALHLLGIVHRDLKASNVLIDGSGAPRVTDFGMALVRGVVEPSGVDGIVGTPGSVAPEQIAAELGPVDARSDVWALGALLFRLTTGRHPVPGASVVELALATVQRAPLPLRQVRPDAPAVLDAIAARCLRRRPERRYATARQLADDLERFLRGEPTRATPAGVGLRLLAVAHRRPALSTHLGALLALGIVSVVDHFALGGSDARFFWSSLALMVGLVGASFWLDAVIRRRRKSIVARSAWAVLDALVLTAAIALGDGPSSGLVQVYPLLVAAAAFWGHERIVLVTAAATMLMYGGLVAWAEASASPFVRPVSGYVLVLVTQALIGVVVGHDVQRGRRLAEFARRRG